MKAQSLGGQATAIKLRTAALEAYYASPNLCEHCQTTIRVRDNQQAREARQLRYCSRRCAAQARTLRHKENPPPRKPRAPRPKDPNRPITHRLLNVTKNELFVRTSGYQSARSAIQKDARRVFFASTCPKQCAVCGYTRHVEVCHRR
jgi:hypothetical protein